MNPFLGLYVRTFGVICVFYILKTQFKLSYKPVLEIRMGSRSACDSKDSSGLQVVIIGLFGNKIGTINTVLVWALSLVGLLSERKLDDSKFE